MALIVPVVDRFQRPFGAPLGTRFGVHDALHRNGHRGVDFIQPAGADVQAIAHGVVDAVYPLASSKILGNVIVLKHRLKQAVKGQPKYVYSGYCHLNSVLVKKGQKVTRGQHIGEVGTTGSASSGNHLHLTMSDAPQGVFWGVVYDPLTFISSHDGD